MEGSAPLVSNTAKAFSLGNEELFGMTVPIQVDF